MKLFGRKVGYSKMKIPKPKWEDSLETVVFNRSYIEIFGTY